MLNANKLFIFKYTYIIMRLLTEMTDFNETIKIASELSGIYDKQVIFHCYWNGILNEKHLYSIRSCYYFNVLNNKHKIFLWLENNISNDINKEISKYCEIKFFSLKNEIKGSWLENRNIVYIGGWTEKSNFYRMLFLYKYGGCWFDLDCLFLRSFDPLFINYEKEVCIYQWATKNYPNNAILISLEAKSQIMKNNINMILNRRKGWGFQRAELTIDIKGLNMLVLPCSWFDGAWINNPYFDYKERKGFHFFLKHLIKIII